MLFRSDGTGRVREYVGGFDDWLRQGGSIRLLGVTDDLEGPEPTVVESKPVEPAPQPAAAESTEPKKKLSYKLQRELDEIPGKIDALETKLAALHEQVSQADFYQQPLEATEAVLAKINTVQEQLDVLIERWAELDS